MIGSRTRLDIVTWPVAVTCGAISKPLEAPPEEPCKTVAAGSAEDGKLRHEIGAETVERRCTDHHHHAGKAENEPKELSPA